FNLAGSNHATQALEVFGVVLLNPQEQRSGIVQARANVWMLFQKREEGQVGVFVALLDNVLEIAGRLVRVDDQDEVKRRIGGGHGRSSPMITRHPRETCHGKDSVACINPKEVAGKAEKHFLQGLKPLSFKGFTPGLKPRPPEEKDFSCSLLRRQEVRESAPCVPKGTRSS